MHLNILQENLEIKRYAFVEASAGTGKTFAIEHLVVRLILAGIPIDRLLVMTFTKAAKTELIRRIHERLQLTLLAYENGSTHIPYLIPRSQEKVRLLQGALQVFHESRITTIHGFCQSLLSKYAFEAEMNISFFEGQTREEQLENVRSYLQGHLKAEEISSAQLQIILKHCLGKVERLFEKIVAQRTAGPTEKPISFCEICEKIDAVLRCIGPLEQEKIAEDFQALKMHYNGFNPCIDQPDFLTNFLENGRDKRIEIEKALQWEDCFWDLVNKENLNKVTLKKKLPLILHYPFLIETLQKEISPLFQIAKTPSSIMDLLRSGYQQFKEKTPDKMETPDDLLCAMQKAIEKPRFFACIRREFDAAIIDEFQDTDATQWTIFERLFLSERSLKALYLVGDPKQSIYAFRSADLYSYLRARECFTLEERMHLSINYRAEKALVRALNTLFSKESTTSWMPLPKTASFLEVTSVEPAEEAEENSLGKEDGLGSIHFLLAESSSNGRGTFSHADIDKKQFMPFLFHEILRLQKMRLFPLSRVALLVKDRYQAKKLMEELGDLGIAAVFIRSENITTSPVFSTILALLRALDASYGIYELKQFFISSLVNCLPEEIMSALTEGHLQKFLGCMRDLKEVYLSQGIGACLQKSLALELPGNTTLLDKLLADEDASFYTDFLQIQEIILEECSHGKRFLSQILAFLEEMRLKDSDENKQLQRQAQGLDNAVTVMTMHASKGLEFDVVFAVGLALRTLHRDSGDPEEKDAEKMRLLYVAMTRAKRRLYVPIIIDKKHLPLKAGEASPIELFCARLINPTTSSYGDWLKAGSLLTLDGIIQHFSSLQTQCALSFEILEDKPLPAAITRERNKEDCLGVPLPQIFTPFWPRKEVLSFSSLFQPVGYKPYSLSKTSLEESHLPLGAETGNLVHWVMENLFKKNLHHPLAEQKIRALIEEMTIATHFEGYVEHLVHMILSSLKIPITPMQPEYAPFTLCDVSPSTLFTEMEFCYPHKTGLYKGFIDLFFQHEGLYYLVDWKSNCLSDYGAVELGEAMQHHGYRLQASLYAGALQRYVKLFDTRPFSTCFGGAHYLFLRGEKWESFMPLLESTHG